jgi:hypothetical protein
MDAILLNDIDTTQLRKLAHARPAVCGKPRITLSCIALAACFDRQSRA